MADEWIPIVDDIAAVLHARLVEAGGARAVTFTDDTQPTATQVETLIAQQSALVLVDTGPLDALACASSANILAAARALIAQRVALIVELSYWPEDVGDERNASQAWNLLVERDQPKVVAAARECRAASNADDDDAGPAMRPRGSFGAPITVGRKTRW